MKQKATEENGVISLSGRSHTHSFPARELQKWIKFYASMDSKYGRRTKTYLEAVEALRGLDIAS